MLPNVTDSCKIFEIFTLTITCYLTKTENTGNVQWGTCKNNAGKMVLFWKA